MNSITLITGGAGYIGSHTALRMLENEKNVLIFDNLECGSQRNIDALRILNTSGRFLGFISGDLKNPNDIFQVFSKYKIDSVIHFAAYIQVEESTRNPQKYYVNNVMGTLNLLSAMRDHDVRNIVFSSSAAVYGEPKYTPIDENHKLDPINPYGKSKFFSEHIIKDYCTSYGMKSIILRYFNVIGCDSNGRLGVLHNPVTHLVERILLSDLLSSKQAFCLYGTDYATRDGTCVRDYVNVEDLAEAHILSLNYLLNGGNSDCFNVGTGDGSTVREVFNECERVASKNINKEILGRRAGDPAVLVACKDKITNVLGWRPRRTLHDSIQSAYNWYNNNLDIIIREVKL